MSQVIRKIDVKGKKISLEIQRQEQPQGFQSVVKKIRRETTNQIPHSHLLNALEKMAPHLLISCEFTDKYEDQGSFLQASHFDDKWWQDDERYNGLELTGVHIATKNEETAIYLVGKRVTSRNGIVAIKTPIISFIKLESNLDYPFIDIIKKQFETLWFEIGEFIKGKTGDEQLQMSLQAGAHDKSNKSKEPEPVLQE